MYHSKDYQYGIISDESFMVDKIHELQKELDIAHIKILNLEAVAYTIKNEYVSLVRETNNLRRGVIVREG